MEIAREDVLTASNKTTCDSATARTWIASAVVLVTGGPAEAHPTNVNSTSPIRIRIERARTA
ncbi:MAG TPA: hypothetical protein VGQ76_10170, partial [Thermoanaerobaculia bacterium]|nr:hypothetical protein [Thermoanaerobaculia bacterium]